MKYKTANEISLLERDARKVEDIKILLGQEWLEYSNSGYTVNLLKLLDELPKDKLLPVFGYFMHKWEEKVVKPPSLL